MADGREKAFPVSWDQFHRDARALAWRLASSGPFEAIVAITRGGLVPAAIIARELNLRIIETVCVASYHDYKNQGGLRLLKPIDAGLLQNAGSAKVLVVDDLVDTGATVKLVREMLPDAHYATVYAKPQGRPMVDTFITEVSQDTWIYFPWDMGLAFQPPIAKDSARLIFPIPLRAGAWETGQKADVAKPVDARDLKSLGLWLCGFDPRRPHHDKAKAVVGHILKG